jgi:hypothetical protein
MRIEALRIITVWRNVLTNCLFSLHQGAFTHGFICEFANAEDRKY